MLRAQSLRISMTCLIFAALLAACSNDESSSKRSPLDPIDPPVDPPTEPPVVETPAECERPLNVGFAPEIAAMLSDLAEQAYDVDASWQSGEIVSTRSDCWELVKIIEHVDGGAWVDTQLYVAKNTYTGDVVVSFRGSQESTDAWTDIAIGDVDWTLDDGTIVREAVHDGFNTGYQSVKTELRAELIQLLEESDAASCRVYFTGHSLGGALATLAALDPATPLVNAGCDRSDIVMYSLGAPRSISERLTPHFASRVPNAYGIAILRDWVTHVPESLFGDNKWEHIPNMVVLHGAGSRTRVDEGPGASYNGCIGVPIPFSFAHHGITLYQSRIDKLGAPSPSVSLSVSSDGNMKLHWATDAVGPCDWAGLYRGYPTDADDYLGVFSWDWAEDGSSYKTWWAKGDNYYGAYVTQFDQIVSRSSAYVPSTPSVWISRYDGLISDWVQINWSVSDPGENDFIALYDSHPPTAGTNGYLTLQWEWALDGNSYATNTIWSRGYYVAYIMEDDEGNRRMLAWSGPN
jgi:hypothetical protein